MSKPESEILCQEPYHVFVTTRAHSRLVHRPHVDGRPDVRQYDVEDIPERVIVVTVYCSLPPHGDELDHEAPMPPPDLIAWKTSWKIPSEKA